MECLLMLLVMIISICEVRQNKVLLWLFQMHGFVTWYIMDMEHEA